jgi:hypothetical protein
MASSPTVEAGFRRKDCSVGGRSVVGDADGAGCADETGCADPAGACNADSRSAGMPSTRARTSATQACQQSRSGVSSSR